MRGSGLEDMDLCKRVGIAAFAYFSSVVGEGQSDVVPATCGMVTNLLNERRIQTWLAGRVLPSTLCDLGEYSWRVQCVQAWKLELG